MERVEGVVTRVLRYGDRQWVVHVFTRERGFLSLFATGNGRRGVVARCMEVGEVVYVEGRGGGGGRGNGGGGMGRLVSFDREMETMGIWGDVVRANVALLWGEVLEVVTRDAGVNEELFSLVRYGVEYLGTEGVEAGNFNLWFLWVGGGGLGVFLLWGFGGAGRGCGGGGWWGGDTGRVGCFAWRMGVFTRWYRWGGCVWDHGRRG